MLTVSLSGLEIGIFEPDRDVSVKDLPFDIAGWAQGESCGLSSIDISYISGCWRSWKLSDGFTLNTRII